MLVGRLKGLGDDCARVCDHTGSVRVVHPSLWRNADCIVVLQSYHVVTETATTYNNVLTRRYVHPLVWTTLPPADTTEDKYVVYFVVVDRGTAMQSDSGALCSVKVLTHHTVEGVANGTPTIVSGTDQRWHCCLRYDCCYSLSSPSPLPREGAVLLTDDHRVSVLDCPAPSLVSVLDVSDVLRMCTPLLPR